MPMENVVLAVEHPRPVDALVDGGGEANDLGVLRKWARAVRTPQSSSAVSIDEISLSFQGSPVSMSLKWEKKPWVAAACRSGSAGCGGPVRDLRGGLIAALVRDAEAERPKPVAAMLAILRGSSAPSVLSTRARSSTWPVLGPACSAKKRQPRR
jgi:hypothetical protein